MRLLVVVFWLSWSALAASIGTLSGNVQDEQGIAIGTANVSVQTPDGQTVATTKTTITGDFWFASLPIGSYQVHVEAPGFASAMSVIRVFGGPSAPLALHLSPIKEIVVEVKAQRRSVGAPAAQSRTEISQKDIEALPQGNDISLPRLLTTTSPGVVQGAFNQMFFRGSHGNIQYQIDGVQMPDSPSGTLGEAISPRNIDHMDVLTGGIPAEYGQRLSAVLNIVTKTGPETPGGTVELNYGSYDTMSPHAMYGGSNAEGSVHYFVSAGYHQTHRGLDTPEPINASDLGRGGREATHDFASGNDQFVKVDWLANNTNKLTFVAFNSENNLQIPNFPSSFGPNDPVFQQTDRWGNGPPVYTPANTNDSQSEANAYFETVWRHTFSDRAFLQLAPYYKYSFIHFQNDPANDLISGSSQAASFYENRHIDNVGVKADYTYRLNDQHLLKTGAQVQSATANGVASVQTSLASGPQLIDGDAQETSESLYVQDDFLITKRWTLNAGLRFDAVQYRFSDATPADADLQPRIGISYLATDTTKLHAFYGRLFQPAPMEDLRAAFITAGTNSQCTAGQICPYDIKAEKDDYYEVGIAQQFLETQSAQLNVYYKSAKNMLDDTQLLNTAIAQPYNFAKGFAYGVEFSLKGDLNAHWSEYFNYAYEIAKGYGLQGGIFAFPSGQQPPDAWQFLDHVQIQTANAGVTYKHNQLWWTTQALYGSGLRTGDGNGLSLPEHLTFDTTVGYQFKGESWWSNWKVSGDILNLLDTTYPITIANGFNGNHYAAGREFFVHLGKDL